MTACVYAVVRMLDSYIAHVTEKSVDIQYYIIHMHAMPNVACTMNKTILICIFHFVQITVFNLTR